MGAADPPTQRTGAGRQAYIESVGGKLHGFWYAFGEHDGYNLWEAPGQRVDGRGRAGDRRRRRAESIETMVLLRVEETLDALRKVEQVQYRPPGA